MKHRIGSIFFVIDNCLIFLLSTYKSCYIKYTIVPIGKSGKNHNNKEVKSKYLIDKALDKFNQPLSKRIIRGYEEAWLNVLNAISPSLSTESFG